MSSTNSPPERSVDASHNPPGLPGVIPSETLDTDNPWPGLAAFREADQDFFYGREQETVGLLRLVRRELLTVLYGQSGLGKTSLLRAGVFPKLRTENGLPVYLRVDHDESASHPVRQVMEAIRREAKKAGIEAPDAEGVETLWEYFHRTDAVFWSREHDVVTPVLVFDQFEELFTLGKSTAEAARRTAELLAQLADLVEGSAPASVKDRLDASPEEAQAFAFGQSIYRVVFSLREDFLPDLEDLKDRIPSIANRMHLRRMTGEKAVQVVLVPGRRLVTDAVADEIVRFVAGGTRSTTNPGAIAAPHQVPLNELYVEPALLSLFCRELNEARRGRGEPTISSELLHQSQTAILDSFYERCMRDRAPAVRTFVEDELVTVSGYRNSAALDDALATPGVTAAEINTLVDRRLLRVEERGGVRRVELTHDVLTDIVRASRDRRQQREALEREKKRRIEAEQRETERRRQLRRTQLALVLAMAAIAGMVAAVVFYARMLEVRAREVRTLARSNYQAGLHQLQEGGSRRGAAYLARALRYDPNSMFIRAAVFTSLIYTEWPLAILSHAEDVTSAAFSPDGTRVVTSSADHTARLWDVRTGAPIGAPLRHDDIVYSAAFSPNGTRVITVSADGTARLWDGGTGASVAEPLRHGLDAGDIGRAVRSAAFSPDGSRVVTASEDRTARLWDANTGKGIGAPLRHERIVYAAAFSPDSRRVVTASADGTARLWDAETGAPIGSLLRHDDIVWSATFDNDGARVVTASQDHTARLWDGGTGAPVSEPLRHDGGVLSAAFNADGTRVVTASDDRTARLWDAHTGASVAAPLEHEGVVCSAAFNRDGTRVVTASRDGTARLWNAGTGALIGQPLRHENVIWSAAFSPDGTRVVTASKDHTARLWETRSGTAEGEPLVHEDIVYSAAFSPDGTRIATASADGAARLWDAHAATAEGEPLRLRTAHQAETDVAYEVRSVAFSPDGTQVVTASTDGTARLWDTRTGTPIGEPIRHSASRQSGEPDIGNALWSAAFSSDGSEIVTASADRTARLWDARSHALIGKPMEHNGMVSSAAFNPDGTRVVTASGNTAQVWDARTGAEIPEAAFRHDVRVWSAAFNPDGTRVVTASADKTAQVWDVGTRKPVGERLRHDNEVQHAAFSPDGELVVTASADGTSRLWDASTGTPIGEPLRHDDGVWWAAFSRDGTWVVTASADDTSRLWEVSAGQTIQADDLAAFVEVVAGSSLDDNGALTEITDRDRRLANFCAQAAETKPGEPLTFPGLVHWFCADRATRTVSPRSVMKVPEYEEILRRVAAAREKK